MELFIAFNQESWGTLDVFDYRFDFDKMVLSERQEIDEADEKIDLQNTGQENRITLLFVKNER